MRIFLVSNMYPSKLYPVYGIFVKNFETLLNSEGCDFSRKAVLRGRSKNLILRSMNYISFASKIFYIVIRNDYDVMYVHYVGHSLIPLLFIRVFVRKPLVVNAHGSDVLPTTKLGYFIQHLVAPIVRGANLVVVPSQYFKEMVVERYQIDERNVYVSPSSGIDTKLFKPGSDVPHEIFTIGYVSRIDQGKGWDILLNAVKIIRDMRSYKFRLLIIGGGSEEKELRNMVSQYSLHDQVELVGVVKHDKLPDWYRKMDVFVFPTTRSAESLGLVGLEAMSCGVPVIGSDIGGLKGYIEGGFNGELFAVGDEEALIVMLQKFLSLSDIEMKAYRLQAVRTALRYDSKEVTVRLKQKLMQLIVE